MEMDVFTGQMTEDVVKQYQDNNILIVNVPRNMTKYYQPLDLTVNGYCKKFLKRKFTQWYWAEETRQLANKVSLEDVQAKLLLRKLKPLQASWIIEFFNETTTSKGREIIDSGWNASGIKDAVKLGREKLPSFDPFEKLDPMMNETEDIARSTVLRMTAIACLLIEELEVLVQWKMMKILTKKMTVNGSINLLNWMGKMVLTCLMTRCKSNRDEIKSWSWVCVRKIFLIWFIRESLCSRKEKFCEFFYSRKFLFTQVSSSKVVQWKTT